MVEPTTAPGRCILITMVTTNTSFLMVFSASVTTPKVKEGWRICEAKFHAKFLLSLLSHQFLVLMMQQIISDFTLLLLTVCSFKWETSHHPVAGGWSDGFSCPSLLSQQITWPRWQDDFRPLIQSQFHWLTDWKPAVFSHQTPLLLLPPLPPAPPSPPLLLRSSNHWLWLIAPFSYYM